MISTQSEDMCRRLLMKNLFGNEITRLEKFRMLVNLHRFNTMYHKRSVFETRNKLVYEGYKAMLDFNLPLEDNMPGLEYFFGCDSRIEEQDIRDGIQTYLLRILDRQVPEQLLINLKDIIRTRHPAFSQISARLMTIYQRTRLVPGLVLRDIYHDSQNVHSSSVQDKIRSMLVDIPHSSDLEFKECVKGLLAERDDNKVRKAITKISTTTSYRMQDVFCFIWKRICKSPHRAELVNRLHEELSDMSEQCVTGCVTRLFNTLSGFDDKFTILFSIKEELTASWNRLLMKTMSADMQEELTNSSKSQEYIQFIRDTMNIFRKQIETEYTIDDSNRQEFMDIFDKLESRDL